MRMGKYFHSHSKSYKSLPPETSERLLWVSERLRALRHFLPNPKLRQLGKCSVIQRVPKGTLSALVYMTSMVMCEGAKSKVCIHSHWLVRGNGMNK